jgi:hypothetical protein
MKMMTIAAAVALAACAAAMARAGDDCEGCKKAPEAKGAAGEALGKLRKLSGDWVVKGGDGKVVSSWRAIAQGSTVVETLFAGTPKEMITVYHADGDDLVLTHFCAMGNQPRMKLVPGSDLKKLSFVFAGGTNVRPEKDGHMHELVITLVDDDSIKADWTSWEDGKAKATHSFELIRRKAT